MNANQAFWFFAGVLSTAAVLYVVNPLLGKAQSGKAQPGLRGQQLIAVAGAVGLALSAAAIGLYLKLDDSMSMMPDRKLSTAGPVIIEARTSRSVQAMPESGDFQGVSSQLDPAAGAPVRVVIQRVIG